MRLKAENTDQKLRGAYYTPQVLAETVVSKLCQGPYKSILEPSCGDGSFIDALDSCKLLGKNVMLTAIEVDKPALEKVERRYGGRNNCELLLEDFFEFYSKCKAGSYDLIVGNPPYIRYQYLEPDQRTLLSSILSEQGMKANKLVNAWVGFMVACTNLLADSGQIVFVIPAEVMQVAYAEDLRLFLATHYSEITLLSFQKLVFEDIEQEVIVFIGRKGVGDGVIRVVETVDAETLANVDFAKEEFQPLSKVHEKWTKYFITAHDAAVLAMLRDDERLIHFSDLAIINVGVTTGNNKFFSLSDDLSSEYDLDEYTLPLIGRSAHASGVYFTDDDWRENRAEGKRARLLVLQDGQYNSLTKTQQAYIDKGESAGENKGYKCRIRDSWYAVPSIWIPDAFFLRRNNLYPKFVLNDCGAISTDTMHRFKFLDGIDGKLALLSYYNSIAFAVTERCGRS